MRLADKRFRGPDREPWDPQRALHSVFGAETFAATVRTTFADTLSTCDIEMDKSMYWVPALMYEGTPAGHPAHLSGSRHERRARTLSDRPTGQGP
jgi:hypothetical protein